MRPTWHWRSPRRRSPWTLVCAFAVCWPAACLPSTQRTAPEPADSAVVGSHASDGSERIAALESEVRQLRQRAVRAELRLMERDAQIRELEQRLALQQGMLEETIEEVVRAKAKLRGIESKAQAASQLAEAEIALKALQDLVGGEQAPEYGQAAELIESGTEEFRQENFGGAIYLSGQAKSLISLAEARIKEREVIDAGEGEVTFSVPLPLEVTANTNVRAGPGLDRSVITILPQGSPVVGYSYTGEWIRVKLEDDSEGWVYQALLKSR